MFIAAANDDAAARRFAEMLGTELDVQVGFPAPSSAQLSVLIDQGLPRRAWSKEARGFAFDVAIAEPRPGFARALAALLAEHGR